MRATFLRNRLTERIEPLAASTYGPTYSPHERCAMYMDLASEVGLLAPTVLAGLRPGCTGPIWAASEGAKMGPAPEMPCKLPGGFRQASGNLPGKSLTQLLQIRRQPYRAEQGQRTSGLTHLRSQLSQSSLPTPSGKSSGNLPEASGLQVKS